MDLTDKNNLEHSEMADKISKLEETNSDLTYRLGILESIVRGLQDKEEVNR